MAQTNFTPILTYKSDTASAVPSAGNLTNSANGAELAVNTADKRLFTKDSGGNVVEIGTNPSSLSLPNGTANGVVYANGSKVLTTGSALTFDGTNLTLGANTFVVKNAVGDSSGLKIYQAASDVSTIMNNYNGSIVFGTNNAEQMRLTSTGLGIGTSSPGYKLSVATTNDHVGLYDTDITGLVHVLSGNGNSSLYIGADNGNVAASSNLIFGVDGTERARITSGGDLLVGTTSAAGRITSVTSSVTAGSFTSASAAAPGTSGFWNNYVAGLDLYDSAGGSGYGVGIRFRPNNGGVYPVAGIASLAPSTTTSALVFHTQDSNGSVPERARIDSSGRLLVGTTSTYSNASKATIQGQQTGGGDGVVAIYNDQATSADSSPPLVLYKAMTTTSSSARFVQFYAGGTATPMGGIVGNGASNVQFASLSDAREKTNIAPISGSLEKIVALRPVAFDWIANGEHCPAGFVAQDVEQVFPEFVVENMANDGQESRKGLTGGMTGGIVAHLVKAIQEQQAIITDLRARVAALEAA